ncbi:hypothetical protein R3P38DRAFT_3183368 [Favolaschia claudopus]|uniref:Uncharacterized protein n=1 Tax=Favolaschia claudopus TaxID=2862362 RepID=A0AAW0CB05_9AGAR
MFGSGTYCQLIPLHRNFTATFGNRFSRAADASPFSPFHLDSLLDIAQPIATIHTSADDNWRAKPLKRGIHARNTPNVIRSVLLVALTVTVQVQPHLDTSLFHPPSPLLCAASAPSALPPLPPSLSPPHLELNPSTSPAFATVFPTTCVNADAEAAGVSHVRLHSLSRVATSSHPLCLTNSHPELTTFISFFNCSPSRHRDKIKLPSRLQRIAHVTAPTARRYFRLDSPASTRADASRPDFTGHPYPSRPSYCSIGPKILSPSSFIAIFSSCVSPLPSFPTSSLHWGMRTAEWEFDRDFDNDPAVFRTTLMRSPEEITTARARKRSAHRGCRRPMWIVVYAGLMTVSPYNFHVDAPSTRLMNAKITPPRYTCSCGKNIQIFPGAGYATPCRGSVPIDLVRQQNYAEMRGVLMALALARAAAVCRSLLLAASAGEGACDVSEPEAQRENCTRGRTGAPKALDAWFRRASSEVELGVHTHSRTPPPLPTYPAPTSFPNFDVVRATVFPPIGTSSTDVTPASACKLTPSSHNLLGPRSIQSPPESFPTLDDVDVLKLAVSVHETRRNTTPYHPTWPMEPLLPPPITPLRRDRRAGDLRRIPFLSLPALHHNRVRHLFIRPKTIWSEDSL